GRRVGAERPQSVRRRGARRGRVRGGGDDAAAARPVGLPVNETGPDETGPGEAGPGETGPGETGPGETGPGETGTVNETGPVSETRTAAEATERPTRSGPGRVLIALYG